MEAEVIDMPAPDAQDAPPPQQGPPPLSLDQAWGTIVQACNAFNGNFPQHQAIQQALQLVAQTLMAGMAPPPSPNRQERRHPTKPPPAKRARKKS